MSRERKRARKPATARGLLREVAYLHADEAKAIESEAKRQRCSKSEIMRRIIRKHFGIED